MTDQALPMQTTLRRSGTSLADETYQQLRDDILNAELAPDARLRIRELCQRYGTGLSPVREALNRLSSEGWVKQSAQKGFTVASFSLDELDEILRTRRWIDEIGVRESIRRGDSSWEEAVLLASHRLSRTERWLDETAKARNPTWYDAHKSFHGSLIDACGSEWLKKFSDTLFDVTERYRALSRLPGARRSTHLDEHQEITQAVITRDADKAVELLFRHYDQTARLVREQMAKTGVGGAAQPVVKRRYKKAGPIQSDPAGKPDRD